jgi:branched-chain amino acid transport system substrate-binding protein
MGSSRFAVAAALSLCICGTASAQVPGPVRVGVLNDIAGIFQDTNGQGSIEAARMAVEDFAGGGKGIAVEIVAGDHENKPDVGSAVVRRWMDLDKIDAIVDVPNSAVGLAVNAITRGTRVTLLASSTASSDLSGKDCSPNAVQWVTDTWAIANSTTSAVLGRGGTSWYFITVNYALGTAIEKDSAAVIEKAGGTLVGSARHPLGTADFSSFLLQAQSSKAKVIGMANAGADLINLVKQASEFDIRGSGQSLVGYIAHINDIHAMGLQAAQGIQFTDAFYWDLNDETRAFAKRFFARMNKMPSANQAGVYSSTLAYLRAVAATGSTDAKTVVPKMKEAPFHDSLFGDTRIRDDGRVVHNMYLFEVKKPAESRYPWDYYALVATVPADKAFRPMNEGGCPLLPKP